MPFAVFPIYLIQVSLQNIHKRDVTCYQSVSCLDEILGLHVNLMIPIGTSKKSDPIDYIITINDRPQNYDGM